MSPAPTIDAPPQQDLPSKEQAADGSGRVQVEKIDLRKDLKHLYSPSAKSPVEVQVPPLDFIMIDGRGAPEDSHYREALEALYPLAYTLKFALKKERGLDYPVMPLEGLWWAEDMNAFANADREAWIWTAMIMQPDFVTQEDFESARAEVERKKGSSAALAVARLERFEEGRSAQIMHIGPYSAEGPTITKLHDFIEEQGGWLRGKHHEIYLGDPRRSAPEKLKTVIRQPFE
jgi:hypothetical protein